MAHVPVKATKIAAIKATRSSDGKFGLIRFSRDDPPDDAHKDIWLAVPADLLPFLATVAVNVLPQPEGATVPNLLAVKGMGLGGNAEGEVVLSLTIARNATLSYRLDPDQADQLLAALQKTRENAGSRKNGKKA